MRTTLYINGKIADIFDDIAISLNYAIADIREPDKRDSAFSKSITLPGSASNNKIFTDYFDLKYSTNTTGTVNFTPDFNPNLKASVKLFTDGVQIMSGHLKVDNVSWDYEGDIQYEVSIFGRTKDLFSQIGEDLLTDINWSDLDHEYSGTNIINSWTPTIGTGYVYPYINKDETTDMDKRSEDFQPAIFVKEYIDRIFENAGYVYDSDFFNSDYFKRLIIPYSGANLKKTDTQIKSFLFHAFLIGSNYQPSIPVASTGLAGYEIPFNHESLGYNSTFDTTAGRWTCPAYVSVNFSGLVKMQLRILNNFTAAVPANYYVKIELNKYYPGYVTWGQTDYIKLTLPAGTYTAGQTTGIAYGQISVKDVNPQPNEIFILRIVAANAWFTNNAVTTSNNNVMFEVVASETQFKIEVNNDKLYDTDTVVMNNTVPEKIKQKDFLRDIIKMFNLYVEPDQDNINKLNIEPRNDFYNNTKIDWTEKVDISKPIKSTPMPFLEANKYEYSYKSDKDYWNEFSEKKYGYVFGTRNYFINNDFLKKTQKLDLMFSPTPNVGNPINSIVCPQIINVDKDGKVTRKTANIRILIWGGLKQLKKQMTWHFTSKDGTSGNRTTYPYAGMTDDPYWATEDLSFAVPDEIFYDGLFQNIRYTDNNLFNKYHKRYIDEITDRDSRLVTVYAKLDPSDILTLDFRKVYHVFGVDYRLNKIEDYDPIKGEPCKVELLKLKRNEDFTSTSGIVYGGWEESPQIGEPSPTMFAAQNPYGNSYYNNQVQVTGENNFVSQYAKYVNIVGVDNKVFDGAANVEIHGSSGIVVDGGVSGVTVFNSSGIHITESNTTYINNIAYPHGSTTGTTILQEVEAFDTVTTPSGTVLASDTETIDIEEGEGMDVYVSGSTIYVEQEYLDNPIYFEDFISGSNTSGAIGVHNWSITNGTVGQGNSNGRPGVIVRTSTTTASTPSTLYPGAATGSDRFSYVNFDYIHFSFKLGNTADIYFSGGVFSDCALSIPVGVWLDVRPTSGYFEFASSDGVAIDYYSSDFVIDTEWHDCKIIRVNNGSNVFARFIFDGQTTDLNTATFTRNPISGGLTGCNIGFNVMTNSGGASKSFTIDYVKWKMTNVYRGY